MAKRPDYGQPVDQYFRDLPMPVKPLAADLREIVRRAIPDATEIVKWGVPVYEQGGIVCSIRARKNYAALQFFAEGASLRDPDDRLEGSGKTGRHVKVRRKEDLDEPQLRSWIEQVVSLRRTMQSSED